MLASPSTSSLRQAQDKQDMAETELLDSKFDLRLDYRNPQEKREMIKADGNHAHGGYHIHRSFN